MIAWTYELWVRWHYPGDWEKIGEYSTNEEAYQEGERLWKFYKESSNFVYDIVERYL